MRTRLAALTSRRGRRTEGKRLPYPSRLRPLSRSATFWGGRASRRSALLIPACRVLSPNTKGNDLSPWGLVDSMVQTPAPPEEQSPSHEPARRPPLAEIDTWELWQAWRRGEREVVWPWVGLLLSFCVVLAGMYSFFYFSTSQSDDTVAQIGLTVVLL